ncbi:MAG: class I SAM-dependent methyltransferase [Actinomycetota bacterium]
MSTERNELAERIFTGLPDRYDRLAELFSFGQNGRWRRAMVSHVAHGARVLDVATGTAGVAIELVRRRAARVVGIDQNERMLRRGVEATREAGVDARIELLRGRGEQLPFVDASFDAVTFTYLMRYVDDPASTLKEMVRVLRPGGTIAALEFHVPGNALARAAWWFFTRLLLPAAGRAVSGDWHRVGQFLGPSISDFYREYPLPDQVEMWRDAGLQYIGFRKMSLGGGIVIWAVKV